MNLSAEVFADIVAGLKSDVTRDRDQRREPRVGVRARVEVVARHGEKISVKRQTMWVRDVSAGGIGLLHGSVIPVTSLFILELPRKSGLTMTLIYRVMHCRPTANDQYAIGGKLEKIVGSGAPADGGRASHSRAAPQRMRQALIAAARGLR